MATPAATTAAATTVHTAAHIDWGGYLVVWLPLPLPLHCRLSRRRPRLCPSLPLAGGSYYEPSGRGGFGSARAAAREREAKPKKPAEAGGGLGAVLRRLFCFG